MPQGVYVHKSLDAVVRFRKRISINQENGCWEWNGGLSKAGYGTLWHHNKSEYAHRFSAKLYSIDIPKGMTIDHLCRNRKCVNPNHLEVVTRGENVRRGIAGLLLGERLRAKTQCIRGHQFTDDNTYVDSKKQRHCRKCHAMRSAKYRNRRVI